MSEGVHRAGPQRRLRADWSSRSGSAITRPRPDQRLARSSAPAGSRWMPVISAPDIVVGIAATRAPLTAAIAFAVSIARPPPRATSGCDRAEVKQRGGELGHLRRRGHLVHGARRARASSGAAPGRAGVLSSSNGREAVLSEQLRGVGDSAVAKDDRAPGVPPDEVAAHPAGASPRVHSPVAGSVRPRPAGARSRAAARASRRGARAARRR